MGLQFATIKFTILYATYKIDCFVTLIWDFMRLNFSEIWPDANLISWSIAKSKNKNSKLKIKIWNSKSRFKISTHVLFNFEFRVVISDVLLHLFCLSTCARDENPHSTEILRKYCRNIPWKYCKIAKIFRN